MPLASTTQARKRAATHEKSREDSHGTIRTIIHTMIEVLIALYDWVDLVSSFDGDSSCGIDKKLL
jgi:hypothetical protein